MASSPRREPTEVAAPPKGHRVSRACLSCRMRKAKCDLYANGASGNPPCRRCVELDLECVIGGSRRGGRRIKGLRNSDIAAATQLAVPPQPEPDQSIATETVSQPNNRNGDVSVLDFGNSMFSSEDREERSTTRRSSGTHWREGGSDQQWVHMHDERQGLEGHIASSDLLNPSDALQLLAQVADQETGERPASLGPSESSLTAPAPEANTSSRQPEGNFPEGLLTVSGASTLIQHYHDKFHPFFPIAHSDIFSDKNVSRWAREEPYLLTAVLTVASKDEPQWAKVHEGCLRHVERLVSKLIWSNTTTVGAVEALLILAEWAPQPPQESLTIGRGKEDPSSWMLVGMAIRLGYLQRLEQTGLSVAQDSPPEHLSRQRIAWAACYMSDRQVSIRLGKGFWSRGPGPSISLRAADFPSLQAQSLGSEDLALLFQAHLELTQLFSNAHDILYSSTSHREQLYMGGEYVRYIDDFTAVLQRWKLAWGSLSLTPHVKPSLMLSYDFLRLYINAFAFQANVNRALHRARSKPKNNIPLGGLWASQIAGTPDARFIYESIDAANSILGTLNGFIDPETGFKYMPIRFYLYVIYAAVFLYKACLAGSISGQNTASVRRAVRETIKRLRKTSNSRDSLGNRYARSLNLLWSRPLAQARSRPDGSTAASPFPVSVPQNPGAGAFSNGGEQGNEFDPSQINGFSWWDLDSLGQFIAGDGTEINDCLTSNAELESDYAPSGLDGSSAGLWATNLWNGTDVLF